MRWECSEPVFRTPSRAPSIHLDPPDAPTSPRTARMLRRRHSSRRSARTDSPHGLRQQRIDLATQLHRANDRLRILAQG